MRQKRVTATILVGLLVLAAGCGGRRSDTIQASDLPRDADAPVAGSTAPGGGAAGAPQDSITGRTLDPSAGPGAGDAAQGQQMALGPTVSTPAGPVQEVEALRDVYFEFDSASISSDGAREALAFNANWMQRFPAVRILIEGHTDQRGSTAYNLALGERRAIASRDYMITLGIPRDRLQTISYGKERPADPAMNEAAWSKNRRAHFVVLTQASGTAQQ